MINLESALPLVVPTEPDKWLEDNIYFSQEVSPNQPGRLSFSHQPWIREILQNMLNPYVKEITLCTGAQLGKSTLLLLATLLLAEFRGGQMLWLLPTDTMAARAVKKRILPLIKCNPHFHAKLPTGQISMADSIPLGGMPIYYTGVRNPSKLASIPANILLMDEAAKFERVKKDEADPISLAKERIKSFADSLVIQASTPNIPENKFWQSYLDGTQSKYYMPCPHCQKLMLFEWNKDRVQWEEDKPETARYICPHCQQPIDDAQRLAMMDKGKWVDDNPAARDLGKLSYHLNSLYSPYISIPEMARKFHDATHSLTVADDLRNFYNSWLAMPYEEHCSKVYYADVQSCIHGMYHKGIVPDNTRLLVMGVDIGQNVSHWAVSAITYDNKIYVVDWGTMIDFKSDLPDKIGVARLFDSLKYTNGKGEEILPDICLVDSGYATEEVYSECMRAQVPGTIIPVKGGTSKAGAWGRSIIRTHPDAPFPLLLFSDFHLKRALYVDLIKQGGLVLPLEADNMILQGLSGQEMKKSANGKCYFKERPNDHLGDAVKYSILALWVDEAERGTAQIGANIEAENLTQ